MNEQNDNPVSQTGVAGTPAQFENVQYNVPIGNYESKMSLAFSVTTICACIVLICIATLLFQFTGKMFGYSEEISIQILVSILIPVAIVGLIAWKRFNNLIRTQSHLLEDIKFKKSLRTAFLTALILSLAGAGLGIFFLFEMISGINEVTAQNFFFFFYFSVAAIMLTLWLYTYQLKTQR